MRTKPGDLITENALERPLLLLRDLPDMEVTSELGPSKTQVGAADLTVKLAENRRPVSGYVDVDNYGNRFSGEYRLGLNLNTGNLTGYGDLLSFRGFITNDNLMQFGRLSYIIPVGPYGTRVGVSGTAFEYELGKDFESLQSNGDGKVLHALRPAPVPAHAQRQPLRPGGGGAQGPRGPDRFRGTFEERKITAGKLGVVGDFRDRLLGQAQLLLRDLHRRASGISRHGSRGRPGARHRPCGRQLFQGQHRAAPPAADLDNFNLLLAYAAQLASKNLTAAEKMSLGGPNGVRAYPVGEEPRRHRPARHGRAALHRAQLSGVRRRLHAVYVRRLRAGQDAGGSASGRRRSPNKRSISAAASACRSGGRKLPGARGVAWSLDKETPISDRRSAIRVLVQAIKWF